MIDDILQYSDDDLVVKPGITPCASTPIESPPSKTLPGNATPTEPSEPSVPSRPLFPSRPNISPKPAPYNLPSPYGNTPFSGRNIDHIGLLFSEHLSQENIVYTVTKDAYHQPTRVVFVGNLRKPMDAMKFQDHLRVVVRKVHPMYRVIRVWMNRSRTHALVLTGSVDAARALRAKLNGSKYPDDAERQYLVRLASGMGDSAFPDKDMRSLNHHDLFVDYLHFRQMSEWIFEEDYGPRNAVWRVDYRKQGEYGEVAAEHTLLEGDFRPVYGPREVSEPWTTYFPAGSNSGRRSYLRTRRPEREPENRRVKRR